MIASYVANRKNPRLDDLGFAAQAELFDRLAQSAGGPPPVLDSTDLRADPPGRLAALCLALGIAFTPRMQSWPAGPRPFDGVWAPHWYGAVHRSTGFDGPEGALPDLSPAQARLAEAALPHYEALARHRIRP